MNQSTQSNPEDLFAGIDIPPKLQTAEDGANLAIKAKEFADLKAEKVKVELDVQEASIEKTGREIVARTAAIQTNHEQFNLSPVLVGWFSKDDALEAEREVLKRERVQLNIDTASSYGVVPDNVVNQFVNSAITKATGEARMEVARVLDTATGITRKIAEDKAVSAEEVAKKAKSLLEFWHNAQIIDVMFKQLFEKTLNRVVDYQNRLAVVGQDLAKKQVTLESISASLVSRRELVKRCLYDTCISGMALTNILAAQHVALAELERQKQANVDTPPQVFAEKIQEQQSLIEITTKRLVDLKAFAIKLIGLYSVLGTTRVNVGIIKADVVFTRTNLMATLGLQLGLVVDIISVLRISKAAKDIREAEAQVAEKVGVASDALNSAGNEALVNIDTTMRSLQATIAAAVSGIKNTNDNMQRVQDMSAKADEQFSSMFSSLAV